MTNRGNVLFLAATSAFARLGLLAIAGCTSVPIAPAVESATRPSPPPATRPTITLQADAAEVFGTLYATARPGYTGASYVTGIDGRDDHLVWHANAPVRGLYLVELRYSAPSDKQYGLNVNGVSYDDFIPATGDAFATHVAGKVTLEAGDNTITLHSGSGYYDVDRIQLIPTAVTPTPAPPGTLVDPEATPEARALMRQLLETYGRRTPSGGISFKDADTVYQAAGVWPAIMGGDFMDYSPSRVDHGAKASTPPERLIAAAREGYDITMLWHWNAPTDLINANYVKDGKTINGDWSRGFYTEATTFDLAAALQDPQGSDYKLLLRDIDAIAEQLKKFSDAKVPVLWRPLHEADGKWFWWGAKGPGPFKQLWLLMFDRLTRVHHLHNLIWVYTGSTKWEWFPPDDQFDVIGVDAYPNAPGNPQSAIWDALLARYGMVKPIALSEYGGVPDLDAMAAFGVHWLYFASWGGKLGPDKVSSQELARLYHAASIVSRGGN